MLEDCFVVRDFDWTAKLVASVDCLDILSPLIQITLHCEDKKEPLVFEFTPEEAQDLLKSLSSKQG